MYIRWIRYCLTSRTSLKEADSGVDRSVKTIKNPTRPLRES